LANFESDLLDLSEGGGLDGREQFKHVIFAPQKWSGYEESFFPGVRDALDEGDLKRAQEWVVRVVEVLGNATRNLAEPDWED
jgi:hypothetical protein